MLDVPSNRRKVSHTTSVNAQRRKILRDQEMLLLPKLKKGDGLTSPVDYAIVLRSRVMLLQIAGGAETEAATDARMNRFVRALPDVTASST